MDLANIIISATSLVILIGYGAAALHWSRTHQPPMPPLPQWDDDEEEAGEKLAEWRRELNTPSLPDEDKL